MSAPAVGHGTLVRLSWPILVSMLSYTAMTVADSIFVGRMGTAPLAAIGLSAAVIHLPTSFGQGVLGGVRVLVARATGAEDPDRARAIAWQGLWLAAGMGVVVAALVPLGRPALGLLGASAEVLPLAASYFEIRTVAAPVVFVFGALSAFFQGRGDTRTPMVAAVLANGLNIALDPVLIFGLGPVPALGISGAALATVVGMSLGAAILVVAAAVELLRAFHPVEPELLADVWRIGAPKGVQYVLDVASWVLFAGLLAGSGDAHLAAHVLVVRIVMVSFLPGFAIGEAAGVLVGQCLGAGRPEQARVAHRLATGHALGVMGVAALVFAVVPDPLIAVFGAEAEVHAIARQVLLLAAAIQVFDAVATVALCVIGGAGDTRFAMVASVGAAWLVKVPVAVVLVRGMHLGAVGAWLGLAAEIAVLAVVATWRVRGSAWLAEQHRVARI